MTDRLDGVTGDGRKRVEPNWITGKERVYEPVRRVAVDASKVRMAEPEMLGQDPT